MKVDNCEEEEEEVEPFEPALLKAAAEQDLLHLLGPSAAEQYNSAFGIKIPLGEDPAVTQARQKVSRLAKNNN